MAKENAKQEDTGLPFGPKNYVLMAGAVVSIVIGYIALGSGSITLAPILLVLGYCVLFPLGIIIKGTPDKKVETEEL